MTNEKHLHIKLVCAHIRGPHRAPNPGCSLAATAGIGGFPSGPGMAGVGPGPGHRNPVRAHLRAGVLRGPTHRRIPLIAGHFLPAWRHSPAEYCLDGAQNRRPQSVPPAPRTAGAHRNQQTGAPSPGGGVQREPVSAGHGGHIRHFRGHGRCLPVRVHRPIQCVDRHVYHTGAHPLTGGELLLLPQAGRTMGTKQ